MIRIKILFGIIICLAVLTGTVAAERPTVIITFDDAWYSVLQNAKPIMDNNSQKGVVFIITNQPELSWNGQPNNYMNVSQLQQLYDSGWDLSSHTYSHVVLTKVNDTTLNYELIASKDWLNTHGFQRGAMFLAYPEGSYNAAVIVAVQANNYAAARTIEHPDASYSNYNLTSTDVYKLKAYEIIGGIDNDITVIAQINNTIAANGLLILAFHKIVDNLSANPTDAETEFKTTDFQNVSNYLQSSDVDVLTLSDYFGAVPLPTYMPPTPIDTTLDGSKNLTWTAGFGNVTDYFNYSVNGTWYNQSITTFYNATELSPGNYTVKVYAVNSTNGITVNSTPAILNSVILAPQTPSSTSASEVIGNSSGDGGGSSSGSSSGIGGSSKRSSGGGGGSSGGGGSFYDSNAEFYERRDSQIHNGTVSVIPFTQNGLVSEVTVNGIKNYGEATAVVSLLKKNPTDITIDNVHKFFSVNMETIKHENEQLFFKSPTITVFLSKENIGDKVVKAYRFINGSWILVDIEELTGTDENRHFKLKLNRFSNFAVVLESKTTTWTAPAKTSESNLPTMTQTGTEPKSDASSNISPSERILGAIKNFLMLIFGR